MFLATQKTSKIFENFSATECEAGRRGGVGREDPGRKRREPARREAGRARGLATWRVPGGLTALLTDPAN